MTPTELDPEVAPPEQPAPDESFPDRPSDDEVSGDLSWVAQFQRVSGLVLWPLALLVFVSTYIANDVADLRALDLERRWSNPALQLVDWAFLALALAHGLIGWHWYLGRHLTGSCLRPAIEGVSMSVVAIAFAYGSLAIFAG